MTSEFIQNFLVPVRVIHVCTCICIYKLHVAADCFLQLFYFNSETTDADKFDMVLELVAGLGRTLFKLFQHPSLAIVKAAGLIMKSIIEEGDQDTATKMQELSLCEGALPRHLHTALFTASTDNRLLTHRQLSRHLIALWITGNPTATALLHRILVGWWRYNYSTALCMNIVIVVQTRVYKFL